MPDLLTLARDSAQLLANNEGRAFTVYFRELENGFCDLHYLPAVEPAPVGYQVGATVEPTSPTPSTLPPLPQPRPTDIWK